MQSQWNIHALKSYINVHCSTPTLKHSLSAVWCGVIFLSEYSYWPSSTKPLSLSHDRLLPARRHYHPLKEILIAKTYKEKRSPIGATMYWSSCEWWTCQGKGNLVIFLNLILNLLPNDMKKDGWVWSNLCEGMHTYMPVFEMSGPSSEDPESVVHG